CGGSNRRTGSSEKKTATGFHLFTRPVNSARLLGINGRNNVNFLRTENVPRPFAFKIGPFPSGLIMVLTWPSKTIVAAAILRSRLLLADHITRNAAYMR